MILAVSIKHTLSAQAVKFLEIKFAEFKPNLPADLFYFLIV
jgi:hypothetical protein